MTIQATFTADISDFRRSMADAVTVVNGLQRTTSQVNAELRRFGNDFSGANVARRAETMARAIRDVGGVSKLTQAELKRAQSTIDEYVQKFDALGKRVPANIQQLSIALRMLTADEKAVAVEATKAAAEVSRLASLGTQLSQGLMMGLGGGVGLGLAGGIAQGVMMATAAIKELGAQGQQLSALSRPFEALQGGAGRAAVAMEDMRRASMGLVSEVGLLQAANKASLLGLDELGLDMSELAGVATRLGRAMGLDATTALDNLTTALGRQSILILDNLGITMKAEDAHRKYAATVGKSAADLTEQEKRIAWVAEAMSKARDRAAQLGDVTLTVGDQWNRLTTLLGDAGANLFSAGNEAGFFTREMDMLVDAIEGGIGEIEALIESYSRFREETLGASVATGQASTETADFVDNLRSTAPALAGAIDGVRAATATLEAYRAVLASVNGEIDNVQFPTSRRGDITLPDRTMGANRRSTGWLSEEEARLQREYVEQQEEALRRIEQGASKAAPKVDKLAQALDKISGKDAREEAERVATAILKIGAAKIPKDEAERLAQMLMTVKRNAELAGQAISQNIGQALNSLTIPSKRIEGLNPLFVGAQIGMAARSATTLSQRWRGSNSAATGLINSTNPLAGWLTTMPKAIEPTRLKLRQVSDQTKVWLERMEGVADAVARLSQISGGRLDGLTRAIGNMAGGLSLGMQLGKTFGLNGKQTGALSVGFASAGLGFDLGQSLGRVGGTLAGAGSGAAMGALVGTKVFPGLGTAAGAGIGAAVGGVSGYFGARAKESELRKLKDLQAGQLLAEYGSLESLLDTVGRLGMNSQGFLRRFYGDPKEFAKAVADLTAELTKEKREADKLAKALTSVAQASGVATKADLQRLAAVRRGSPGEDTAREFLQGQTTQLTGGLTTFLEAGRFDAKGAASAGMALGAAFTLMQQQGMSTVAILRELAPALEAFQKNAVEAGKGSTAEFDSLGRMLSVLKDEKLGPFIDSATGAGQILSALANTGMLTQEAFSGLASSVADAFYAMEADGKGGIEAVRLLQGPLQNVWQLMQDQGLEVDENTAKVIEFAEKAGLVGDKFRPAVDRMAAAMDKLVERLSTFIDLMSGIVLPDAPTTPSAAAGGSSGAGDTPGFAGGTGGVRDFGRESLVRLHGREAVLTEGQYKALLAGINTEAPVIAGLERMRMGAKGGSQTIVMQLGRQTLARAVVQDMPRLVTLYGGA